MRKTKFSFTSSAVDYYFDGDADSLSKLVKPEKTVLITDENVYASRKKFFSKWDVIVLKPGEAYKQQRVADAVIEQLIEKGADRSTTLVGVGGGVVTDMTGYIASVFLRGIRFGFVPTSLLAMVDASIGGKNGIDVGVYKNMVGAIRQPDFLLYDYRWLKTLPQNEWKNGFAEIIKHACIKDKVMFNQLVKNKLSAYRNNPSLLSSLIRRNALIKTKVVQQDEYEKAERKLLNFGHTLGHAIENIYELSHGEAISVGMTYACHLSESLTGFRDTKKVTDLLDKYGLPTYAAFDLKKSFAVLQKDKKKVDRDIQYVLLNKIGKGVVYRISLVDLHNKLEKLVS
jgi:3-dehydroquinate synthase